MPRIITERTFFQFLKCPTWVYFDAHEPTKPHDPLLLKLLDDGLIDEAERKTLASREDLAEVKSEDIEEAFLETLAFMREGRQTIYHGTLIDKHWVGHPDVLEKVEGKSSFGAYYYVAADIKRLRVVRDDYKFQGCFYAELLRIIQGVKPQQGYVITPDATALSYLIEPFETEFHLTLAEIEAIVAGKKPAHFLTSGCKQSPWFHECKRESETCDDLSVLNRIWREEVARLKHGGVRTIQELSKKSVHELQRAVPDMDPARLEWIRDQAVALKEKRHIVRGRASLPESRVELYFDIESDPLRDFDYLFGVLIVENNHPTYRAFFAETPDELPEMWKEFLSFMESYADAPIFHYGSFEAEVLRRFGDRYGWSVFFDTGLEDRLVDLLYVMRPVIVLPLAFYSLKDVATHIGFAWRSHDASGANSVLWFEEWLKTKDPSLKKKILDYNEDDVLATWKVERWLREQAGV